MELQDIIAIMIWRVQLITFPYHCVTRAINPRLRSGRNVPSHFLPPQFRKTRGADRHWTPSSRSKARGHSRRYRHTAGHKPSPRMQTTPQSQAPPPNHPPRRNTSARKKLTEQVILRCYYICGRKNLLHLVVCLTL